MRTSGDVVLKLKHPYSDGTNHLLFSGLEFVEKLAARDRVGIIFVLLSRSFPGDSPGSAPNP